MTTPTHNAPTEQEVARRVREYREQGLLHRTMPRIIYRPPFLECPWRDCDFRIAGVDFQLEQMGDQSRYQQLMNAWWQGPGLVGRCPGCGQYVLFRMDDKQCVADPTTYAAALLPDDWHASAYLLS